MHLGGSGVWGFEFGFGMGFCAGRGSVLERPFRAGRVRVDESHLDTFFLVSRVDAVIHCSCEGIFFELRCYYIGILSLGM